MMTTRRPYRSKLQPFEAEIAAMRQKRPPTPYREILRVLREHHGLVVQLSTLANFVKVRSKGKRTGYLFGPPWHQIKNEKKPPTQPYRGNRDIPQGRKTEDIGYRARRPVTFTFSEQYNLTRLTAEEAAALEKKLDEELKGQS